MKTFTLGTMLIALCGCAAGPDISATATTSAEMPRAHVGVRAAVGDIIQAQCAHARACGAVSARCDDIVGTSTRADLLGRDCDVIDGAYLAACIDAVRNQACASDPMTEHAPAICQSAWLCR